MIVEIVGIPGSGKSTLYQKLIKNRKYNDARRDYRTLLVVFRALVMTPLLLKMVLTRSSRVSFLNLYSIISICSLRNNKNDILLDQGPVFDISQLVFNGIIRSYGPYYGFLTRLVRQASYRVVFLNVSYEVAHARVIQRVKPHRYKSSSHDDFIEYMKIYEQILNVVISDCGVSVNRYE